VQGSQQTFELCGLEEKRGQSTDEKVMSGAMPITKRMHYLLSNCGLQINCDMQAHLQVTKGRRASSNVKANRTHVTQVAELEIG